MIGETIAHYSITEKIGAGGMGEVWRARDTKLNRDVALKIIPDIFAQDAERMARFGREAQVLASLNHPNIAAIYGTEESGGKRALVLELVEGDDLSQRLRAGSIPMDECLDIARQIAEALEAAHDKGVVHRDLKPANVKLSPEGVVKVLDFGLAKALEGDPSAVASDPSQSLSPTLTQAATKAGVILGTAAYMSPEQAKGKVVDRRTDIFSFGLVLFEMLAGRKAFEGDSISDTLASILKLEPEWGQIPADTPPHVQELLHRCLEKDPKQRLQSIGEARIALTSAVRGSTMSMSAASSMVGGAATGSVSGTTAGPGRMARAATLVAVAILAGAASGFVGWRMGGPSEPARPVAFSLHPDGLDTGSTTPPALSPDGRRLAYSAGGQLWIRELEDLEPRSVEGGEEGHDPFWSPDGQSLAFNVGRTLMRASATGGAATIISKLPFSPSSATWAEDGTIYVTPGTGPLQSLSSQGGDPVPALEPEAGKESDFHTVHALPGNRGLLYAVHRNQGVDTIEILADGERHVVQQIEGERIEYPVWSASGHVLYSRRGDNSGIWAVPYSLSSLEVTGKPFLVAAEGAMATVSRDGTLLYVSRQDPGLTELVWIDREGRVEGVAGPPRPDLSWPEISPDGTKVLATSDSEGNTDIWMLDTARGTWTRMTFEDSREWSAVWNPSADRIYISAGSPNTLSMLMLPLDGSKEPEEILPNAMMGSIDRDGRYLVVTTQDVANNEWDVGYLDLEQGGQPEMVLTSEGFEGAARLSPDGRLLAYLSFESGRGEVYLVEFPSGRGKRQVSQDGGAWPRWGPGGKELFFLKGEFGGTEAVMAVSVEMEPRLRLGTPEMLFDRKDLPDLIWPGSWASRFDVAPDGERFLMVRGIEEEARVEPSLVVNLGWMAAHGESGAK